MNRWCFDTSAIIEPWCRHYPPTIAPSLWEVVDEMWSTGKIIVPEEVIHETKRVDDDIHNWVKERKTRLTAPDNTVQHHVKTIMNRFPRLVAVGKGRSGGDPWMIATAASMRIPIVTYEISTTSQRNIKIPDVCKSLGVDCFQFHEFLASAKITLSATRSIR